MRATSSNKQKLTAAIKDTRALLGKSALKRLNAIVYEDLSRTTIVVYFRNKKTIVDEEDRKNITDYVLNDMYNGCKTKRVEFVFES